MTPAKQITSTTGSKSCNTMTDVRISSLGNHRGAKRVWIEGVMLNRAGFTPKTRYQIKSVDGSIVLVKQPTGFRVVSSRVKAEREIPIIDINSSELLWMFKGLDHIRLIFKEGEIYILPLASEIRAQERFSRVEEKIKFYQPLTFGSLAHGGGVMDDALEAGFALASVPTELAFANEIRSDLTDHAISLGRTWKPTTIALNGKMQELAFDEYVMRKLGRVDVLSAGLPCSGASISGRSKRHLAHAEAHPEVGHLVVAFLAIVARVNPLVIVFENVVPYGNSASMDIIRTQLKDMHYEIQETILEGASWGAFENRKRMVMVAVTRGMKFSFDDLKKPAVRAGTLAEILEPIPLDDPRWSKMEGLKEKEKRDAAANKSFAMQVFNETSSKICTLTKGLSKNRSTDAKIQHPTDPELLRVPTAIEHARAKQIPEAMISGLSETIAHEMLGQSVVYQVFVSVGNLLADCIKAMALNTEMEEFQLQA